MVNYLFFKLKEIYFIIIFFQHMKFFDTANTNKSTLFNSFQDKRIQIISLSIFEGRGSSLEQIVVAVESYNIAVMALYIRLSSIAVQTDC